MLIAPREDALFIPSSGKLIPLERRGIIFKRHNLPEIISRPLVKTDDKSLTNGIKAIRGKHSGVRSGLVFNNGTMYKLKGCVPTTEDYYGEPYGGQVLSRVEQEIEATGELSRILAKQGLSSSYRALGYFRYPLTFKGEPLACSIMEARGDTRLDELMFSLESFVFLCYMVDGKPKFPRYTNELGGLFYKLGQWAGYLKRTMDDNNMPWSMSSLNGGRTNAHIGNYVIFPENGELLLGVVDLDDCHFPFDNQELRENEYHILTGNVLDPVIVSANTGLKLPDNLKPPLDYRYRFVEGFEQGYMNTDAVRIRPGEIEEALKAAKRAREQLREEFSRIEEAQEHRAKKTYIDSSKYLDNLYGRIIKDDDYNSNDAFSKYKIDGNFNNSPYHIQRKNY